jgi:hypothetical protein
VRFTIRDTRGPCHCVTRSTKQERQTAANQATIHTHTHTHTYEQSSKVRIMVAMLVMVISVFLCYCSSLTDFNNSACKIAHHESL